MNLLVPIVFLCAHVQGQINYCDGHTAFAHFTLAPIQKMQIFPDPTLPKIEVPISNPMLCILAGMEKAAKEIEEFKTEHPNKDVEFRVVCQRLDEKI